VFSAECRFAGQVYELPVALERFPTPSDVDGLRHRFIGQYERTYGPGTAWRDVPIEIVTYTVTVRGRLDRVEAAMHPLSPRSAEAVQKAERTVFLPERRSSATIPIYDDALFTPGTSIAGPAIIDADDTTVYVPAGMTASRDELLTLWLKGTA
jgi:N-methylhydantoinase A